MTKPDPSQVRLTQHVLHAGCASKISPAELEKTLSRLPSSDDPRVLVGVPAGDDAGVYKLSEEVRLVQSVDVFTPCVDDPYVFGQIAASNSVSDIYAMGGKPLTALSILSFPTDRLPEEVMCRIMRGGLDKLREAGVAVIGGHSIKTGEILFGYAVTGTIAPGDPVAQRSAKPGDRLVLTKPIGTGMIAFAAKDGKASKAALDEISRSMSRLNNDAAQIMQQVGVNGCTDITGFGLFGHLIQMARHSRVTVNIHAQAIPVFDEALSLARQGVMPCAAKRNREFVARDITAGNDVEEAMVNLGFDAQTSGGLLIAVPEGRLKKLVELSEKDGVLAVVIGEVTAASEGKILVT